MSDKHFEILLKEISSLKEQIKEQNIPYMLTKEDLVKHYNMSELEEWIERQALNAS